MGRMNGCSRDGGLGEWGRRKEVEGGGLSQGARVSHALQAGITGLADNSNYTPRTLHGRWLRSLRMRRHWEILLTAVLSIGECSARDRNACVSNGEHGKSGNRAQ